MLWARLMGTLNASKNNIHIPKTSQSICEEMRKLSAQQSICEEKRKQSICIVVYLLGKEFLGMGWQITFLERGNNKESMLKTQLLSLTGKKDFQITESGVSRHMYNHLCHQFLFIMSSFLLPLHIFNSGATVDSFLLPLHTFNSGTTVDSGKIPTGFDRLWVQIFVSKLRESKKVQPQCCLGLVDASVNNRKLPEILADRKKSRLQKNKRELTTLAQQLPS